MKPSKKTVKKPSKPAKKALKKLPPTFGSAAVVRGQGMDSDKLDDFLDCRAMDEFDAVRDMWLVIEDRALRDLEGSVEVKGFRNKEDTVLYAQARANGNVDHRVLRVTEQVLVIGTWNDL